MATPPLRRHLEACNNIPSPAGLMPFCVAGRQVGWLAPETARALTFRPKEVHFDRHGAALAARARPDAASRMLAELAAWLADRGFCRIRDEAFDVREGFEGPVLATLDRGALPAFGVAAQGVHLNGLVRRGGRLLLWMGVRAADKAIAPGALDNMVAGGVPAGLDAGATLLKEAAEEAGIGPDLAGMARPAGRVSYIMSGPEGLRRDLLHCYDLELPEGMTPSPRDGEVERFELLPAEEVLDLVRRTDRVKFNVNLVLIDLFLREGLIPPDDPEAAALRAGLDAG
jgi:8-oxo-dGTP pyrophosphatase MutT (NUDIX family)